MSELLLQAALNYAARGWPLLPLHGIRDGACDCGAAECSSPGKHPIGRAVPRGLHDATIDPAVIRAWWQRWPNANVGVCTGEESGFIVLDVDSAEALDLLKSSGRNIPDDALWQLTGRGCQYLFAHPGFRVPNSTSKVAAEVDVKGDGGYIVAPPSMHYLGSCYEWKSDCEPGPAPEWLLNFLRQPAAMAPLTPASMTNILDVDLLTTVHGAAERMRQAPERTRNTTLNAVAFSLGRRAALGLHRDAAEAALVGAAMAAGLGEAETRRTFASGWSAGLRHPLEMAGGAQVGPEEPPWPPRQSLPPATPPVPILPEDMVPAPLRAWLVDEAERACLPLEYLAVPALVAAAATLGRTVCIKPEAYSHWKVVPNLWGGIVGHPGTLKSAAISAALAPLNRIQAKYMELHTAGEAERAVLRRSLEVQIQAIEGQIRSAVRDASGSSGSDSTGVDIAALECDLRQRHADLVTLEVSAKRFVTQDATTEKLGELLRDNPRGLLLSRDELAGWLHGFERTGREGDREFYLEAWNGDGSYTVDRIARGTVHIEALCLSLVGSIQPGKLNAYVREAVGGGVGADGLLQRLQLLVYPDASPDWRRSTGWAEHEHRDQVHVLFERLEQMDPQRLLADPTDFDSLPALRFSPEAQVVFDGFRNRLEIRLRSDELKRTPAFCAHLAKYRSLMPTLALVFHALDVASGKAGGPVLQAHALLAVAWCDLLEAHARKVYSIELGPGESAAHALAEKIRRGTLGDGDAVRDIYRNQWSGLASPEIVRAGLDVLVDAGWVRLVMERTGGRSREIVLLHPELKGQR